MEILFFHFSSLSLAATKRILHYGGATRGGDTRFHRRATTPSRKLFKPTRQNILIGRSPRLRCRPAYPRSPRTKWTTRAPLLPPVAKSGDEAIVDDSLPPSWDKQRNAVIRRPTIISYAGRKGGSRCEKVSFSCEATKLLERVSNVAPLYPGLQRGGSNEHERISLEKN